MTATSTQAFERLAGEIHAVIVDRMGSYGGAPRTGTARRGEGDGAGSSPDPDQQVEALLRERAPLLGPAELADVAGRVRARLRGLGPLEPLLALPDVTDVMVNGDGSVWFERRGILLRSEVVLDHATTRLLAERVVAPLGLRVDRSSPAVDARLPDGSRVHAILPPLAVDGPHLTIRRFSARPVPLSDFVTAEVEDLLTWAVRARANIVVSGGTGAGKTTLLNALGALLPPAERVVTVEDAAELRLPGRHVIRLESRPAGLDGGAAVGVRELVRHALRMRPDRIVVGEVRGPEALDMLQALNTGHDGSLSTCHANSPADALRRLETMVLTGAVELPLAALREQVASAVDLVVQVARRGDGARRVVAVDEVLIDPPRRGPRTQTLADETGIVQGPRRPVRAAEVEPWPT